MDIASSLLIDVEREENSSVGNFCILEKVKLGRNSFVGNYSTLRGVKLGEDSRVWHYCNLYECKIGKNTQIGSYSEIKTGAIIGDRCRFQSYVFIPEGTSLGNDVFIGPCVTFLNDFCPTAPKAIQKLWKLETVVVEDGVSIGGGVVILPGVRLGMNSRIGAGAVVTQDVPPQSVVYGSPAKVRGDITMKRYESWR